MKNNPAWKNLGKNSEKVDQLAHRTLCRNHNARMSRLRLLRQMMAALMRPPPLPQPSFTARSALTTPCRLMAMPPRQMITAVAMSPLPHGLPFTLVCPCAGAQAKL